MPDPGPPTLNPQRPIDWRTLRLWQIQPLRDLAVLVAILGVLYLGKLLSVVTVPMLLAVLLAYLFEPVVLRLTRLRWISRQGAAVLIIVATTVLIVGPVVIGAAFGAIQGAAFVQTTTRNVLTLADAVSKTNNTEAMAALPSDGWRRLADSLVKLRRDAEAAKAREAAPPTVPPDAAPPSGPPRAPDDQADPAGQTDDLADAPAPPTVTAQIADQTRVQVYRAVEAALEWVKTAGPSIGQRALSTGVSAIEVVATWLLRAGYMVFGAFLTAFFFFFFCTGYGQVRTLWEHVVPERRKSAVIVLLAQMDQVISGFVRGRLTIGAIMVLYYTLAYWLIGAPASLILGPIVGVLSLVPYAAFIAGAPSAMLLLWLGPNLFDWQTAWWWIIAGPLIVHGISQVLDDYLLTPTIQGRSTGMDTPTILFASLAGAVLAGFYGLLVAIPVAACIRILLIQVVWPRFKEWAAGKARDPLPISRL